jgi:hypothetical protein
VPVAGAGGGVRVVTGHRVGLGAFGGAAPGQLRGDVAPAELSGREPVAVGEVLAGEGEGREIGQRGVRVGAREPVRDVGRLVVAPLFFYSYFTLRNPCFTVRE